MKKKVIVILALVLSLIVLTLPMAQASGPVWSDNFDSYPTGQDLHGVGGWYGWDNNPGATAFTTNAQALSAPNSVDIVGAADLVQTDNLGQTAGTYCLSFWQYIPGNLTGISYFLMQNIYNHGGPYNWSVQVNHAGGIMTDDGSGTSMAYIPDQWVQVQLEIDLTNDTQAYIYNGAVFYTGVWNGYISGPGTGANAIAAIDLFANGASSVYYDDFSLTTGPCTGPTPTPTTEPPTETPTAEPPTATPTTEPPTATATTEPPTVTPTPQPTGVELSSFGGDNGVNVAPYVIMGVLAAVGLGWFVSRKRSA